MCLATFYVFSVGAMQLMHSILYCNNILMFDADNDDAEYTCKLSNLGLAVKANAAVFNDAGTVAWMDLGVEHGSLASAEECIKRREANSITSTQSPP